MKLKVKGILVLEKLIHVKSSNFSFEYALLSKKVCVQKKILHSV